VRAGSFGLAVLAATRSARDQKPQLTRCKHFPARARHPVSNVRHSCSIAAKSGESAWVAAIDYSVHRAFGQPLRPAVAETTIEPAVPRSRCALCGAVCLPVAMVCLLLSFTIYRTPDSRSLRGITQNNSLVNHRQVRSGQDTCLTDLHGSSSHHISRGPRMVIRCRHRGARVCS